MKCKDIQDMLFEYIDNNLSDELVETIDTHLNECGQCRTVLDEYKDVRETLLPLRTVPTFPDMKQRFKERVSTIRTKTLNRLLRPALIAVPVVVIVALVLALQPFGTSEDTSGVIARAYAATSKLNSFRYVKDEFEQDSPSDESILISHGETLYLAPDRYHISVSWRCSFLRRPFPGSLASPGWKS